MDELQFMLKAIRDLHNSDPDTIVQGIEGLIEAVIATGVRLDYLNRWLESRGLPLTWDGPLDAWGWVLYDDDGNVAGYDHEVSGSCPPGDVLLMDRWDGAPEIDRVEALRIEVARRRNERHRS